MFLKKLEQWFFARGRMNDCFTSYNCIAPFSIERVQCGDFIFHFVVQGHNLCTLRALEGQVVADNIERRHFCVHMSAIQRGQFLSGGILNQMNIPKIIHQIWVGPNKIPDRSVHFIRRIQELHPEFEHRLWTNADLIPANFENYELIMSRPSWAQKADLMRYEILYRYGGVYLDIDFEVFKNLSDLLTHPLVVCNEDERIDIYICQLGS